MQRLGKFVVFEGGEGSGKSTQCQLLANSFAKSDVSFIETREPGGTENAESIRELLTSGSVDKWEPVAELLLHFAARREHITRKILPHIQKGDWVISDRFIHSTIAYQAFGQKLGVEYVTMLMHQALANFKPELVFIFDIDPAKGIERAHARKDINRYEHMDITFHERVRAGYQHCIKHGPGRCVKIDANQTIEEIHEQIIETINSRFGLALTKVV